MPKIRNYDVTDQAAAVHAAPAAVAPTAGFGVVASDATPETTGSSDAGVLMHSDAGPGLSSSDFY